MEFKINKDFLLKYVNIADSIIPSKNINAILSNCLFIINKNILQIVSTDNEISVKTTLDIISNDTFSFTLDGKRLASILKELPKGEVIFSVNDNFIIKIKSLSKDIKGDYNIIGTSDSEFPEVASLKNENSMEIDQSILKEMIRKVIFAADVNSIKPVFNGIYFSFDENNNLYVVASDSRRLSMISRKLKNKIELGEGIIIPLKTVHEIYRLLNIGICYFSVKGNQCYFKIDNTEIISRLIDGNFPNFKQVIPKDNLSTLFVNNKKLMEVLRRIIIFTKEPSYKILLNFDKKKLSIEAKTPEYGEAIEEIEIDKNDDEKITIGINSQYIMDSIKELEIERIKIGITGEMSPVTITPENDENCISVIMPIQIKNSE